MTTGVRTNGSRRVALLLVLTSWTCSNRVDTARPAAEHAQRPSTTAPADRQAALEERVRSLQAAFPDVQVQLDATRSRVARMRRLDAPAAGPRAEDVARAVLHNGLVAAALGVSADLRELCQPVTRSDPQLANYAVVRMQQCVNGVHVMGAELVMNVRVKPSPAVDLLTSSLVSDLPASSIPKIGAEAAARTALAAVTQEKPQDPVDAPRAPELVMFVPALFQLTGPSRLCWRVHVGSLAVLVDAQSGSIVYRYSDVIRGSGG